MKTRTKLILATIVTVVSVGVAGTLALASVDVRAVGRVDPKRAAKFEPPWFNFSEEYKDGQVLGIAIGSTRTAAINLTEQQGFVVETSGWGDNRAGQADLYDRASLLAIMLRQPQLNFHDRADLRHGMTLHFRGDRVSQIDVHYINTEAI